VHAGLRRDLGNGEGVDAFVHQQTKGRLKHGCADAGAAAAKPARLRGRPPARTGSVLPPRLPRSPSHANRSNAKQLALEAAVCMIASRGLLTQVFMRLTSARAGMTMLNRRRFLRDGAVGVASPLLATGCGEPFRRRSTTVAPATRRHVIRPQINPALEAHGSLFERRIEKVGDNVYVAIGWSICNTIMVVGDRGVIIVDTGNEIQSAREVATEFRRITDKPVRAVIYTCFHSDHINGVKGHVTEGDV